MDTKNIERYAPQARRDFIQAVTDRAAAIGIRVDRGDVLLSDITVQGDVAFVEGRAFPVALAPRRKGIEDRAKQDGFDRTMEAVAYTWFNRLIALRYMEIHGYLDHGYRVLSHPLGEATPEILQHAEHVDLPGLDRQEVIELKLAGTRDEELYRKLLVAQCNDLHRGMPFLFESVDDASELLLPDNLLHTNSLIRQLVAEIPEEDWQQVEVVGWIYQFYIKERKDEVIGKVVKSEDIPAATQLFTPNWIVRYLVQNSLGRQWMATYPKSPLREHMPYYIEPAEQTEEVQQQLAEITPDHLNPEELTVMDPACGSGHMLIEAYNLLVHIYAERGYRRRDIPRLILEKNLHGLDIDERAAQLAGFALTMRAASDNRRLLRERVELSVLALRHTRDMDASQASLHLGLPVDDVRLLVDVFQDADTFGSLIRSAPSLATRLGPIASAILDAGERDDALAAAAVRQVAPIVGQAKLLAERYNVVITNPPYMGNRYLNPVLKRHLQAEFKGYDKDLFSAFIIRCRDLAKDHGELGFMSPFVWMFISTHEELRRTLISDSTLTSLVQLEYSGFAGATVPICTFTVSSRCTSGYTSCFIRLSDFVGASNQAPKTLEAIKNRECGWFHTASPDDFPKVPGSPIAYWVSDRMREVFETGTPLGKLAAPRQGLATADNDRFLRRWWEVDVGNIGFKMPDREAANRSGRKWFPYNKGGEFRKWYGNNEFVIDWHDDGAEIRDFARAVVRNHSYYFKPGISWSFVSSSYFGVRQSDRGFVFDVGGSSAFPAASDRGACTAFLCSSLAFECMRIMNPTLNFQVGNVATLPVLPGPWAAIRAQVSSIADQAVNIARADWNAAESSWEFEGDARCCLGLDSVQASIEVWDQDCDTAVAKMRRLEEDNNRLFIEAYGLNAELSGEVTEDQITLTRADREQDVRSLASYAVGCALGRYALDEPGLICAESGDEGFNTSRYQKFPATDDGILVVTPDEWFEDDAANRFEAFLKVAWPEETLEENLTLVADSLSPRKSDTSRNTIRRYFAQGFFKDHLKTYKRRPIYWLFTSGKKRAFQTLVYLHRYNKSTLARMRTAYVIPLMQRMRMRADQLDAEHKSDDASATRKRQVEKELNTLADQQAELRAFDEQLQHYAEQQISLDLDDGVKVNYGKFGSLLADVKAVTGK
jgi:hypothetical protein